MGITSDLGVKTRMQLLSERQVTPLVSSPHSAPALVDVSGRQKRADLEHYGAQILRQLLAGIITCSADPELADMAEPFATSVSRHFAFLYAAGAGNVRGADGKLQRGLSLRELDMHIFLEALIEVPGSAPGQETPENLGVFCSRCFATGHGR